MARRRRRSADYRRAGQAARRLARTPEGLRALIVLLVIGAIAWAIWRVRERTGGQASLTPATSPANTLRIATWNLRTFSDRARPDLVSIAQIIREAGLDVVAVQEVQRQGQALERLRRQLNEPWRHAVSDVAGTGERFGFLYRSDRVELRDGPVLMTGPEAGIFQRLPCMATFRSGQFDFILLSVHLSYTDGERRQREAQALARFAAEAVRRSAERDLIVLGDFNEQESRPHLGLFRDYGWKLLNGEPSNVKGTEVYDNLILDPRNTREWVGRVGVVKFDELRFNNDDRLATDEVSDHRPVWADFTTAGPDDD